MAAKETIAATIAELFRAIRALDIDAWLNTFAVDATNEDPAGAPVAKGHGEIRPMLEGLSAAFSSANLVENHVFIVGNEAAVKWTADCVAKNGKPVHFEGIDVLTFNDAGKIQSLRAYWDPVAMQAQM